MPVKYVPFVLFIVCKLLITTFSGIKVLVLQFNDMILATRHWLIFSGACCNSRDLEVQLQVMLVKRLEGNIPGHSSHMLHSKQYGKKEE